jgi:hypothetical protein
MAALVVPRASLPNVKLAGVRLTATTPAPVKATVCGLFDALSLTDRVADFKPALLGENVTAIVQLAPAARVFGLSGQFPPVV